MATGSQSGNTQDVRRDETRKALLAAARRLFAQKGFDETSSDDIVLAAAVTRGAFYFHFEDKRDVFSAVVAAEQRALGESLDAALAGETGNAFDALTAMCSRYLELAGEPACRRIVFVDGEKILGRPDWLKLDAEGPARSLKAGLLKAMNAGEIGKFSLTPLAAVVGAILHEAILSLGDHSNPKELAEVLRILNALFEGLRIDPVDDVGGQPEEAGEPA